MPQIHAAFRLSNYPPSEICYHWINQCFLNYLNYEDIVMYITTCVVMGIDYQVYFCLAVLKHLGEDILARCQDNDLILFLRASPIMGFDISQHLPFLKKLELEYRDSILEDLFETTQFFEGLLL